MPIDRLGEKWYKGMGNADVNTKRGGEENGDGMAKSERCCWWYVLGE